MKNYLQTTCVAIAILAFNFANAQTRYLDQVFDSNQMQADVSIGFNVDPLRSNFSDLGAFLADMSTLNDLMDNGTAIPLNYFQSNTNLPVDQQTTAKLFPITMDVYTPPASDENTSRPVIIYLHTGNFLPQVINGSPTGSKRDSAVVNMCKQWARSGYVVAALNYRLGWNPISSDPDVRRGTLLQAVYRALHDTQTAVRFMRSTMGADNPYGIDPEKIALFGQGSGGYVAQAYVTLSDYDSEVAIDKFTGENGIPYVVEQVDGNIDGGPGATRLPDPLQEAGISKEVSVAANIGGALADISWLEAGDVPMISMHCVRDPFAPFDDGTVVVPTTNEDVVDVSGPNVFIQKANALGNNSAFTSIPDGNDPYTDRARSLYGQTFDYILASQPTITINPSPEGLYPFVLPINTLDGNRFTNQGSPWDWWDFATLQQVVAATNAATGGTYDAAIINAQNEAGNPGQGAAKGLAYIDTIQGYINPRLMCAMALPEAPCTTGITETSADNGTSIYPNPAKSAITVRNDENVIGIVRLFDITGRVVFERNVNAHLFHMDRGDLNSGVYLMEINFDNSKITKKIMFN